MSNEKLNIKYDVPFTMIDRAILLAEDLTVYQKTIYCILCAYANNADKSCYPSYNTISKKAGCSRKKVITTIAELVSFGLVTKQEQFNGKGENISNIYQIHPYNQKSVDNPPVGSVRDTPPGVSDIPRSVPHIPPGVQGTPKLYTDNYNEFNYTYNNNQSISEANELDEILENCNLEGLSEEKDRDLFEQAIRTMYNSKEIKVCNTIYPQAIVRKNMKKLNYKIIAYAYDALQSLDCPPKSPINYMVTVIYRGIFEAGAVY